MTGLSAESCQRLLRGDRGWRSAWGKRGKAGERQEGGVRTNVLVEAAVGRCADARGGAAERRAAGGERGVGGDGSGGVGGGVGESFGAVPTEGEGARGGEGGGRTRKRRRSDAQARGAERPLGTERRCVPLRRMRGAGGGDDGTEEEGREGAAKCAGRRSGGKGGCAGAYGQAEGNREACLRAVEALSARAVKGERRRKSIQCQFKVSWRGNLRGIDPGASSPRQSQRLSQVPPGASSQRRDSARAGRCARRPPAALQCSAVHAEVSTPQAVGAIKDDWWGDCGSCRYTQGGHVHLVSAGPSSSCSMRGQVGEAPRRGCA